MSKRTSFKDLNITKSGKVSGVGKGHEDQIENTRKVLDYELTMIHETNRIDEDGERVSYRVKVPYTGEEFTEFIQSIISTRPSNENDFNFKENVQRELRRRRPKGVEKLLLKHTILMGYEISYKGLRDELVFRVVATDRFIRGAMTRLTEYLRIALNNCQTEDELRVKWYIIKRILSGESLGIKRTEDSYGHGFEIHDNGYGYNSVYGELYGVMVMISEINPREMNALQGYTESIGIEEIHWSISNYIPANIRAVGNMEFNIVDTRQRKDNFYGVKYDLDMLNPGGKVGSMIEQHGKVDLVDVFKLRWMVNSLGKLTVTLVDLNMRASQMVETKKGYMENSKNKFKVLTWRIITWRSITGNLEYGFKEDESVEGIGVFRSINYTGLFNERRKLLKLEKLYCDIGENLEVKSISGTVGDRMRTNTKVLSTKVEDLFGFLYVNDKRFREEVDGYFKEFKDASVEMLMEVLESSKDINLPIMLIKKTYMRDSLVQM